MYWKHFSGNDITEFYVDAIKTYIEFYFLGLRDQDCL